MVLFVVVVAFEMRAWYVDQAILKLLDSTSPPVSASQVAETTYIMTSKLHKLNIDHLHVQNQETLMGDLGRRFGRWEYSQFLPRTQVWLLGLTEVQPSVITGTGD